MNMRACATSRHDRRCSPVDARRRLVARHPRRQTVRYRPARRDHHQRQGHRHDAWYSGKHRDFGANIQAIIRPDGLPIWTSEALPGHLHDLTQHVAAITALPRRTGLRPAHRPLASPTPHHRQPSQHRRHRPRRGRTQPIRIPLPTGISLRSRQWVLTLSAVPLRSSWTCPGLRCSVRVSTAVSWSCWSRPLPPAASTTTDCGYCCTRNRMAYHLDTTDQKAPSPVRGVETDL